MVAIIRNDVVRPMAFAVESEGDRVRIKFGSTEIVMGYEDALRFSQWVRVRAKESKRRAGDTSRHWSVIATLDMKPN